MDIVTSNLTRKVRPYVQTMLIAGTLVLAVLMVLWSEKPPQTKGENVSELYFSSERAMHHVIQMAQKPHPNGSLAIEEVRGYIMSEMEQMGLNPELQESKDHIKTDYFEGNVELTNILGVLKGSGSGKPLLLMSHYDSVSSGPGANDATVSVAALLETVRALRAGPQLQNDIWFLLTDGEEKGLLGAQAFFRDPIHRGAVGMVANFEARGSKGAYIMFQTSEGNGRLVKEFAKAVRNPVSNSLLADLYKKLPNDTDLTVALAYGLPGLNFAYGDGWTAYHTPMDNVDNVSLNTMQHQGENALSVAQHFGNMDLSNLESGDHVYFNLLGLFIQYPASWATVISIIFAACLLALIMILSRRSLIRWKGITLGIIMTITAMLLSCGISYGLWQLVNNGWAERMTMRSGATYDAMLYSICFLLLALIVNVLIFKLVQKQVRVIEMMVSGMLLFLLLLILSTWMLPGASYLFAIPLFSHTIAIVCVVRSKDPSHTLHHPIVLLLTWVIPILIFTSFFYILFIMMPLSINLFSSMIASLILSYAYPALLVLIRSWRLVIPAVIVILIVLLGIGWIQAEPGPSRPVYTMR
ncbi:M28 family peptidase [Paenibacillus sp. EC2-1]|uniref:M28 family peptidase n=1 Tax=Paenibacillus sp. EC2-1 TaxID=3388665 RepID=UPI003BEF2EA5